MVKKLYEVRNRSGDLILENVTSGEIKEELHCTTAQINNARASGDRIFGEYKVEEIDRKLSRKTDFELKELLIAKGKETPCRVSQREDGLWECPVCGATDQHGHNYCDQCGQRLGWEDQI